MKRDALGDLVAFIAVAEANSFTRAAARLGTSQSSLSHTVRRLEDRLGVRLLTRTTRHVAPTEAGEQLVARLRPAFDSIDAAIESIGTLRDKPSGMIRLTASTHAAKTIIFPKVEQLLVQYPDIRVEISVDAKLSDIVTERFDAGIRLRERVEKDMIAVRIGPDLRMAVAGSPAYFDRHGQPKSPRDLTEHKCINLRMPSSGGLYAWEFEKRGKALTVRVEGQFICDDVEMIVQAAVDGLGLAFLPEDQFESMLADGRLVRVLEDWCPAFPGYHLYYPSRRQLSPAFELLVHALRYKD